MIKNIKNDFNSVSVNMNDVFGTVLPKGLIILYYIATLPLGLLMYPFVKIWNMIETRRINKEIEGLA